jgi:hypothetical protein
MKLKTIFYVRPKLQRRLFCQELDGDAKTLLAFNFSDAKDAANVAGFTVQIQPHGQPAYYLTNMLTLSAGKNAQRPLCGDGRHRGSRTMPGRISLCTGLA